MQAKGLWRAVAAALFGLVLASCAAGTGGDAGDRHRDEDKKIFSDAMKDVRTFSKAGGGGCRSTVAADIQGAIRYFDERERVVHDTGSAKYLDRVRNMKWQLQFGLADAAIAKNCPDIATEQYDSLVEAYKIVYLKNPNSRKQIDIEEVRDAMGV